MFGNIVQLGGGNVSEATGASTSETSLLGASVLLVSRAQAI